MNLCKEKPEPQEVRLFDVPTFKAGIYAALAGGIDLEAVQSRPQKAREKGRQQQMGSNCDGGCC